jgi:hypothetical protein
MNKLLASLLLLFLFSGTIVYANETVLKITLESVTDDGKYTHTVIYQGSASSELLDFIKKARPIRGTNIEKAAITEGRYFIEFFDGKEDKKYSVQNNYWIYDEHRNRFLRCSILSNLRGYLIDYIFNDGYSL